MADPSYDPRTGELTSQSPQVGELYAALFEAQKAAPAALGKTDRNEFANFDYVSADRMLIKGREVLTAHGLALFQHASELIKGHGNSPATLRVVLRLAHKSGQWIELANETPVVTKKGTPEDKGTFGALTETIGYAIRGLLMIGRLDPRDIVDVSGRNDEGDDPTSFPPAEPQPYDAGPPMTQQQQDQGAVDLASRYLEQLQQAERDAQQPGASVVEILRRVEPIAQHVPQINLPPEQFARVRDEYNRVVTWLRERSAA